MNSIYRKISALSSGYFATFLLYRWIYDGTLTPDGILGTFSATACALIGMALGLSSAVHLFGLPRRYLSYRRALGVTGYFHALTYTVVLLLLSTEQYLGEFPTHLLTVPSMLGIFSMTTLTLMTLLSNNAAISLIGLRSWMRIMRLGYAAYAALVIRAGWTDGDDWLAWLASPAGLPPPALRSLDSRNNHYCHPIDPRYTPCNFTDMTHRRQKTTINLAFLAGFSSSERIQFRTPAKTPYGA